MIDKDLLDIISNKLSFYISDTLDTLFAIHGYLFLQNS